MPRRPLRLILLFCVFSFGPPLRAEIAAGVEPDPAVLVAEHAAATLDAQAVVRVENAELRLGFARVILESGLLVPLETPSGSLLELIFLGSGRLEAEPPDAVEAGQLELFTGERRLDSAFGASLLAAPAARLETLRRGGRPATLAAAELERAKSIFDGRSELAEREVLDIDGQLLLAALGEPLAAEYFAGVFETEKHGVICLGNDLEGENPLGIGQWVEPAAADAAAADDDGSQAAAAGDEDAADRADEADGEAVPAEEGAYDAWIEGRDTSRPAPPSNTTFEPRHYDLRVELDPAKGRLSGKAEIEVEALMPSRVVKLSLHGDLEVTRVAGAGEGQLYFRRDGETLRVFLPARLERGQLAHLTVAYAGHFFEAGKRRKSRGLRDNVAFYPHAGEIDEATYQLELRWPRGWEVLAAGFLVGEGKSESGYWQQRRFTSPTWGPTFVVGKFRKKSVQVGEVRVNLALGSGLGGSEKDLDEMLAAATDSLEYFSRLFGAYPLRELTLATAPAEISQSLLGFITLSDEMMEASGQEAGELGLEDRRTVIAHEVAHQWWGHQVGWLRWSDQWISEAMANYAAYLWARKALPELDPELGPTAAWQDDLTATLPNGRSIESIGPLVLGGRLDSSLTQDAYEPIVYRKGAVVLDSLCQLWGEERCLRGLGQLAREQRGHKLSTAQFLGELERLSGRSLDGFAKQFIYGTGLPEVYYRCKPEITTEGRWRIEVDAELEPSYHYQYALVEDAGGKIGITWQRVDELDLAALELVAPLHFELRDSSENPVVHEERFPLRGAGAHAAFEYAEEPEVCELDPEARVFARFWDQRLDPKRALYYQGYDRFAAGDHQNAARLFAAALEAATPGAKETKGGADLDKALDASILLAKSKLAVEEGKIPEAVAALAAARRVLPKGFGELYRSDLDYQNAVLAWHQGNTEAAFKKLNQLIVEKAEVDDTEAWLYLALAARAAGHAEELDLALTQVRARGVEVGLLRQKP